MLLLALLLLEQVQLLVPALVLAMQRQGGAHWTGARPHLHASPAGPRRLTARPRSLARHAAPAAPTDAPLGPVAGACLGVPPSPPPPPPRPIP